jgi:hypothetical protein
MARFLVRTRRDQRANAKPAYDAVKDFVGVEVTQIHSPEMVTIDANEDVVTKLRSAIASTYHIEPEIRRGLTSDDD